MLKELGPLGITAIDEAATSCNASLIDVLWYLSGVFPYLFLRVVGVDDTMFCLVSFSGCICLFYHFLLHLLLCFIPVFDRRSSQAAEKASNVTVAARVAGGTTLNAWNVIFLTLVTRSLSSY